MPLSDIALAPLGGAQVVTRRCSCGARPLPVAILRHGMQMARQLTGGLPPELPLLSVKCRTCKQHHVLTAADLLLASS